MPYAICHSSGPVHKRWQQSHSNTCHLWDMRPWRSCIFDTFPCRCGVWMKEAIAPRIHKLGDLQIHSNCTIPTSAQDPFIHIPDSWDGSCGIENQSWHLSISWIWMFTSGCDTKTWACRIPSVWYMMVYGPRISLCTQLYNRSSWLAASGWQFLRTSREFTGALPRTLITSLQSEIW